MNDLLEQIKKGLQSNLYYLCLFSALALPDICGAINSEDGTASKEKYIDWFNKYVSHKYKIYIENICINSLSGEDCYFYRCSSLHQFTSQHDKSKYQRILFIEPSHAQNKFLHNNITEGALNIDLYTFCNDLIEGVEKWLKENENTELFKKNSNYFMKRYLNGLLPYISGIPVIS